jgi:hypothetical protein
MIALIAAVCAAPFISAWFAYYVIKPAGGKSYGDLLPTQALPALSQDPAFVQKAKGRWLLVHRLEGDCDASCEEVLYATRQAHLMLGRERSRVQRVVLGSVRLNATQQQMHQDLLLLQAEAPSPALTEKLRRGTVLIDPLGNQVILWPLNA